MRDRSDFLRLFDRPKSFRSETFEVFWKESLTGVSRIGITLKGRVSSVDRTRVKRVVREWFRQSQLRRNQCADYNVVIRNNFKPYPLSISRLKRGLAEWQA